MKAIMHSHPDVGSSANMRSYLQRRVHNLQKEMIKKRKQRDFDELEELERQVDYLQRRLSFII